MAQLESRGVVPFPSGPAQAPCHRHPRGSPARRTWRWQRLVAALLAIAVPAASTACTAQPKREPIPAQPGGASSTSVVPLRFAAAEALAKVLQRVRPDARVLADQRTNSLILVVNDEADLEVFQRLIEALDVDVSDGR